MGGFGLHRTKRDHEFSEQDKRILDCVLPFFARTLSALETPVATGVDEETLDRRLQPLGLTPRQDAVLRLVLEGLLYRQVAERLHVSVQQVKEHMQDILAKAQVRNRHELAARLSGLRWVKGPPPETEARSEKAEPSAGGR